MVAGTDLRGPVPADAMDIAALLGPPVTARQVTERLDRLARDPQAAALVATGWNGSVIGLVALHWGSSLEADRPVARLTTLVVAEAERRAGIGRLLVKAAAQSARQAGCDQLDALVPHGAPGAARDFLLSLGFVATGDGVSRPLRKRAG